jgi:hypothetical protein
MNIRFALRTNVKHSPYLPMGEVHQATGAYLSSKGSHTVICHGTVSRYDSDISQCYGRLAVVSDVDSDGVCPECRQENRKAAVLYRSKYNRAMLGSRWT